ncbi:MAG: cation:proton antiporter [Armatimonadetes bacterium]|nr:cation:proton antiporter [Armatimonadota bacterium]MDW8122133.1 cation:proton antiporter [Armatimonadota bacterium]
MGETSLVERAAHFIAQLGVILLASKLLGEFFERYLKQSSVLGELVAGVIIGPFALGSLIYLPGMSEPLFSAEGHGSQGISLSPEIWAIAQVGAVLLLFGAGLETDFSLFLRFGVTAFFVGLGGSLVPFFLGAWLTYAFGFSESLFGPPALFMGSVMTATSVGITARILTETGRLASPEGVTILAAAVIDDVLGIIILAIVVSVVRAGEVQPVQLLWLSVKSFGFWLGLTAVAVWAAPHLAKALSWFRSPGAFLGLTIGICFLVSTLTESVGKLAMIIGAYAVGLAFSRTHLAEEMIRSLTPVVHALVPIFFCSMGMMVDLKQMSQQLVFGGAISLAAIISKVGGCGLPAYAAGFTPLASLRTGIGMMPRGEVALIIAGMGLGYGILNPMEFGVAIMMTFVTTFLAPILLVPLYRLPGESLRKKEKNL